MHIHKHAHIILFLILFSGIVASYVLRRRPKYRPTILVLDMDETMIHSPPPHDRVIERPFVREFLRDMSGVFDELVVFTAATRDYASPILDRLESERRGSLFSRRFYRDSCSVDVRTGMLAKDLRILENPLDRTWILDNTPSAYALQPDRGIPISSFEGDLSDRALIDIAPILKAKAKAAAAAS